MNRINIYTNYDNDNLINSDTLINNNQNSTVCIKQLSIINYLIPNVCIGNNFHFFLSH